MWSNLTLPRSIGPSFVERTVNEEAIIDKGLQNGENVVIDGQLGLFPAPM